jgi:predicted nucleic acid-binding protein
VIVLDTNVVSELMRRSPNASVLAWTDAQRSPDLAITAVTAAELRAGVATMPAGRRRTRIAERIDGLVQQTFAGRVLPFDAESGEHYADIVARRRRAGAPISVLDAQIAAITRRRDAALATRNVKDFVRTGVTLIDPWSH